MSRGEGHGALPAEVLGRSAEGAHCEVERVGRVGELPQRDGPVDDEVDVEAVPVVPSRGQGRAAAQPELVRTTVELRESVADGTVHELPQPAGARRYG